MRMPTRLALSALLALAAALPVAPAGAQASLTRDERRIVEHARRMHDDQVAYLGRVVDIPSGTMNFDGVRRTGAVFRASLDSLGFTTRWVPGEPFGRAGHLVAEHKGRAGRKRVLLIGHLDTVFEGPGQGWTREDTVGRGAGSSDMKGGDVVILYALRAMQAAGTLKDANVIVVMTGDEESAGEPLDAARKDLVDAAKRSHAALAFEGGQRTQVVTGRRSSTEWRLVVGGRQGHSSGVFSDGAGYGAIYEAARILDEFRRTVAYERGITFNPGVIVGGERVTFDSTRLTGTAAGKNNIIAPTVVVVGDLRTVSRAQLDSARAIMRGVVARNLGRTTASIAFDDGYPPMSPTAGNERLRAVYDAASRALGYGPVEGNDPTRRGAGDASFVAPVVDVIDGLGADGDGSHSPRESVWLPSLRMQTERAAVVITRLTREKPMTTARAN
jgi:glutamate carboxypeptidase